MVAHSLKSRLKCDVMVSWIQSAPSFVSSLVVNQIRLVIAGVKNDRPHHYYSAVTFRVFTPASSMCCFMAGVQVVEPAVNGVARLVDARGPRK